MDVTKKAREICIKESRPVLIETMSYRVGHHSTSDDSLRYRNEKDIKGWVERNNPITRLRAYMESNGWWDAEKETLAWKDKRKYALQCLKKAEAQKSPPLSEVIYIHCETIIFFKELL